MKESLRVFFTFKVGGLVMIVTYLLLLAFNAVEYDGGGIPPLILTGLIIYIFFAACEIILKHCGK